MPPPSALPKSGPLALAALRATKAFVSVTVASPAIEAPPPRASVVVVALVTLAVLSLIAPPDITTLSPPE